MNELPLAAAGDASSPTIEYGRSGRSLWHPVVVLVAVFAMIQGVIGLLDLMSLYRTIAYSNSNLLVQLAYMGPRVAVTTAAGVLTSICGLLMIGAALPLMSYKPRSRGRLLLLITLDYAARLVKFGPAVGDALRYYAYPGYAAKAISQVAAIAAQNIQMSLVMVLSWIVLTRREVVARFRRDF